MFVIRCPLGDQCSKKGGILAKKLDEESARAALRHHLVYSPYHELNAEDALHFSEGVEVESYTEDQKDWAEWQEDQKDWAASRKRKPAADGGGAIVGAADGDGRRASVGAARSKAAPSAPIGACAAASSSGIIMVKSARAGRGHHRDVRRPAHGVHRLAQEGSHRLGERGEPGREGIPGLQRRGRRHPSVRRCPAELHGLRSSTTAGFGRGATLRSRRALASAETGRGAHLPLRRHSFDGSFAWSAHLPLRRHSCMMV